MFELVMQDIVPLLGLALAGIAGGRFLDFKQGSEKVLTHFVLWLAGPSALILAIQNTTVDALLDASVSFTSLLVFSVTYIGTLVVHRYVLGHGIAAGSIAACCTTSMNLIMIGLPITLSVAGDEAAAVVAISALLSLVVFVPITVALLSPAHPEQSGVTQFFGHIADSLGNPPRDRHADRAAHPQLPTHDSLHRRGDSWLAERGECSRWDGGLRTHGEFHRPAIDQP